MKSLDAKHNRRRRGRQRFLLFPLLLMGMLLLGFHLWRHGLPHPDGPRIGLSVSDDWLDRLGIHRGAYDHVLSRVGAQVVTLEPRKGLEEVNALLESIDGLLLTGGGDVHPALYDGSLPPPHPPPASRGGMAVSLERDVFEIQLIRGALERDMPILGICRGHQILNVAHGGTLQGVRENEALAKNHGPSLKSFGAHLVEVVPNSYLANIMAENALQVNSFHLQAVAKLGVNLRASAIAPDGVIEAIERPDRRMVIGIQWHPEIMSIGDASHLAIFRKLVECAADYRAQRAKFANQQMRETAKKPIAKQTGKTLHLYSALDTNEAKIAFESHRDDDHEIYVMNSDGSNPIRLTKNTFGGNWSSSWSPDGMKIAFHSNRDGNWEVYVMNQDGTDPINLTNNLADDWDPSWSPASR